MSDRPVTHTSTRPTRPATRTSRTRTARPTTTTGIRSMGVFGLLAALIVLLASGCVVSPPPPPPPPPPPGGGPAPGTPVPLNVQETGGVARADEVLRSGVPIARSMNLTSTAGLAVVNGSGQAVPAEFEVLARWDSGKSTAAPIQWLLVTFPASVGAGGTSGYQLITNGSVANPTPASPLTLNQQGSQITVGTGGATFRLGANPSLFDEVRRADGTVVATAGTLTASRDGLDAGYGTTRNVTIEHSGPLSAVVVIDGTYSHPAVGGGQLTNQRRYEFTRGSPTAKVRQRIQWEGTHCANGVITCGNLNAVLAANVRDTLQLSATSPLDVQVIGNQGAPAISGTGNDTSTANLVQNRRAQRTDALSFTATVPGSNTNGTQATGGILAVTGTQGGLAVGIDHMHRFEPQALRLQSGRRVAIDVIADGAYLGARQGTYAELAVSAVASNPSRATLDSTVWAPRNHPLRAWPTAAWFAGSNTVEAFPVGALPAQWADFDTHVANTLQSTMTNIDAKGITGVMTHGSFPRTWGTALFGDEIDCPGTDPTPAQQWDNTYWCASWTDYHNESAVAAMWAMRTGETRWLDDISVPAAKRMQFTQIMQCSPTDTYFYCAQAPAGYGGFRADFNSSHAYFDNLFLHYWLTGDKTVVSQMERGASSMRNYLCQRRPAATCQPGDPQPDPWAILSGRVGSQWLAAFRFVGLASDDASYLDDWHGLMGVSVSRHYAQGTNNGVTYGFWTDGIIGNAGQYDTGQLWMASQYDMRNLKRLMDDTNDAPIGNPAVRPSEVLTAWARTLTRYGAGVRGDGTAGGTWPNGLRFTFTGNRIGGQITTVGATPGGSDPNLYDTGKATLTAVLAQAGRISNDPALTQMSSDLLRVSLDGAQYEGGPLSKIQGEYLNRTPTALSILLS